MAFLWFGMNFMTHYDSLWATNKSLCFFVLLFRNPKPGCMTISKKCCFFSSITSYLPNFPPGGKGEDGTKPESPKPDPSQKPVTKKTAPKPTAQTPPPSSTFNLTLLSSFQDLRRRLELVESGLTSHLHIPLGENSVYECSVHIQKLEVICSCEIKLLRKIATVFMKASLWEKR